MADIRDAATVIVVRAAKEGMEVMLLRRHSRSGFMAGAYVFPGGKVDPADRDAVTPAILEQSKVLAETPGRPLEHRSRGAIVCAAIRETQEEASISLAAPDLVYWAHWITPSLEPRRFDTRFFVALLPAGVEAKHDEREITDLIWRTPRDALVAHLRGDLFLPPPTQRCLEELEGLESFAAIRAAASQRTIVPILPKVLPEEDGFSIVLPWDAEYAAMEGEGLPVSGGSGASRILVRVAR